MRGRRGGRSSTRRRTSPTRRRSPRRRSGRSRYSASRATRCAYSPRRPSDLQGRNAGRAPARPGRASVGTSTPQADPVGRLRAWRCSTASKRAARRWPRVGRGAQGEGAAASPARPDCAEARRSMATSTVRSSRPAGPTSSSPTARTRRDGLPRAGRSCSCFVIPAGDQRHRRVRPRRCCDRPRRRRRRLAALPARQTPAQARLRELGFGFAVGRPAARSWRGADRLAAR